MNKKRRDYELEVSIAVLIGKLAGIVVVFGLVMYLIYRSAVS